MWIFWCLLSCEVEWKAFPHSLHLWGFSAVLMLWDLIMRQSWIKSPSLFSLLWESWIKSPSLFSLLFWLSWILWCFINSDLLLKAFSHSPHLESFSLLWLLSCWLWCGWDLEVLHSLDSQDFAPVGAVWGALGSVCWMEVDLSSKVIMACLKCSSGSLSKWHLTSLVYLTLGHSRLELISLFVISGCNDLIS